MSEKDLMQHQEREAEVEAATHASVPLAAIIKPGRPRRRSSSSRADGERRRSNVLQDALPDSDPPEAAFSASNHKTAPLPSEDNINSGENSESCASSERSARASLAELIPEDADPVWASRLVLSWAVEHGKIPRSPSEDAWYTKVFSDEYLEAYFDEDGSREAAFIQEALAMNAGARLLDLGCGYGRHALPLVRAGFEVVGLDLSLSMLKHGLALAQAESLAVQFVHGDMRDLNFDEVFNGAFCMGQTFGYFSEAENLLVLRGIYRSLCPGARLLIDLVNRDAWVSRLPMRTWFEGNRCLIQEDVSFDALQSRLEIRRFVVFADGRDRVYDISLRLYSLNEIRALLEIVGFKLVNVSGSIHTPNA